MRIKRAGLAALLAICVYALGLAVTPLLQLGLNATGTTGVGTVVPRAYADATSTCAAASNQAACDAGYNSGDATICPKQYPNDPAAQSDCQTGADGAASANSSSTTAGASGSTSNPGIANGTASTINENQCASQAGGVGWLTCPLFDRVVDFISNGAKDLVTQFMAIQPLTLSGPLYNTWSAVRLIANLCFVLIFLFLIFAHTLGFSLDAYAIKKMIPKLVAAAVLVQFSYVLASAVIDAGNILGAGVGALFASVAHTTGANGTDVAGGIIENLFSGIAAGALIAIGTATVVMAAPVFAIILIAVLGVVVVLGVRYFLIGILIISSPLALAAWVLPNTEKYFAKWLSSFVKLVLMYPIIMALISVAGDVNGLIPAAASAPGTTGQAGQSIALPVIKILVIAGALLQIPQTFKWAGGAMAMAHEEINRLTRKGAGASWNSVGTQTRLGVAKERRLARAGKVEDAIKAMGDPNSAKYRWMHLDGDGKVAAFTRGKMHGAGTLMLAGMGKDKSTRQYNYGNIVGNHVKTLSTFDEAKEAHNVENAMMVHYTRQLKNDPNRSAQERAFYSNLESQRWKSLQQADATFLMDFTSSPARREAMMHQLAEGGQLKQPLMKLIQDTGHKEELMAFTRQGFKNYGKEPLLFGVNSANEIKPQVPPTIRAISAQRIASNDFSDRNLEVASATGTDYQLAHSEEAAKVLAENLSAADLKQNYEHKGRFSMSRNKKLQMVLVMTRNRQFYDADGGLEVRRAIATQIARDMAATNGDSHRELLQDLRDAAGANGENPDDMLAYLNAARDPTQPPLQWP